MTAKSKGKRKDVTSVTGVLSLEVLVEEESAATALKPILEKILQGTSARFKIRQFNGKPDLLKKLPARLEGYASARRNGSDLRIVVLVDRDADDCADLKKSLDAIAKKAGLTIRAEGSSTGSFHVLNRIAVRELESWYFGDWAAVRKGFPKASKEVPRAYRGNPDLVDTKCSDDFERALRSGGVRMASKPEWGRRVGPHMDVNANRSPSFHAFVAGVRAIVAS